MKKSIYYILALQACIVTSLYPTESHRSLGFEKLQEVNSASIGPLLIIDPKDRALDIVEAFTILQDQTPINTISIVLIDGSTLTNITSISSLSRGTLLNIEMQQPRGVRSRITPVEDVQEINSDC